MFFGISVPPIDRFFFTAFVIGIAQMAVHFPLQHCFKHGTENIFQRILHILYAFGLVLVEDSLRQLSVWCCFFFLLVIVSVSILLSNPFLLS